MTLQEADFDAPGGTWIGRNGCSECTRRAPRQKAYGVAVADPIAQMHQWDHPHRVANHAAPLLPRSPVVLFCCWSAVGSHGPPGPPHLARIQTGHSIEEPLGGQLPEGLFLRQRLTTGRITRLPSSPDRTSPGFPRTQASKGSNLPLSPGGRTSNIRLSHVGSLGHTTGSLTCTTSLSSLTQGLTQENPSHLLHTIL